MTPASGVFAIVDDSRDDRFFLARALRKAFPGCEIVEFADADEALQLLVAPGRPPFRAIFVDIHMPLMSGFEFADAHAKIDPDHRKDARLLIASHVIDPDDRRRIDAHPVIHGWVAKPPDPVELRSAVGERAVDEN